MKLDLAFTPGFTRRLVGWEAKMVVRGRGSLRCHWLGDSQSEERFKPRHDFLLDEESFARLTQELSCLPRELRTSTMTDIATRRIRTVYKSALLDRCRFVYKDGNARELAFDRIWFELFALVKPVLLDLGMPPDLIEEAS